MNISLASVHRYFLGAIFLAYPVFIFSYYKGFFIAIATSLIVAILLEIYSNSGKIRFDFKPISIYVFFSLPLVTLLWSSYPAKTALHGALSLANLCLFYSCVRSNLGDRYKTTALLVSVTAITVATFFVFLQLTYGTVRATHGELSDILRSISNEGAAIVVACVPYLLSAKLIKSVLLRVIVAGCCCLVVLLSESRGAAIIVLLAVPLYILIYPQTNVRRLVKLTVFILFFSGASTLYLGVIDEQNPLYKSIERFSESQLLNPRNIIAPDREQSDYGRALILREGINSIKNHPLLGIGYAGTYDYFEERHGYGAVSHNLIITAWGEMGLPGLLSLIWVAIYLFKSMLNYLNWKATTQHEKAIATATLVSLICIFIHAQFRPFFTNPMVPIIFAQAYSIFSRQD